MSIKWRQFYTLVYSARSRKAVIIPIELSAEWLRIEVSVLNYPPPNWYKAGWLNQVTDIYGRPYLRPSVVVPLAPSIYRFDLSDRYKIRFSPVPYLPDSIIRLWRSVNP